MCCRIDQNDAFRLAFLFCTISYGKGADSSDLFSLLDLAFIDPSRLPKPPAPGIYELDDGYQPQESVIRQILEDRTYEYKIRSLACPGLRMTKII